MPIASTATGAGPPRTAGRLETEHRVPRRRQKGVRRFIVIGWWLLAGLLPALAQPARVILIRHGEKPESDRDPHLSIAGRDHAARWVNWFTNSVDRTPSILLAPRPTGKHPSVRPIETLEPLALALKLPVRTEFTSDDYARLAADLRTNDVYRGRTVVVCWVHQYLPEFAAALGVEPAPGDWKGDDYDGAYLITFHREKARLKPVHVRQP